MGLRLSLKHSRAGFVSPVTLKFTRAWHTRGGRYGRRRDEQESRMWRPAKCRLACRTWQRSTQADGAQAEAFLWSWYQLGGVIHCLEASLYVNSSRRLWDGLDYSTWQQKTVFSVSNHRAALRHQTGWELQSWVTESDTARFATEDNVELSSQRPVIFYEVFPINLTVNNSLLKLL